MLAQLAVQPEAKVQKVLVLALVLEPVPGNRPKEERAVLLRVLLRALKEASPLAGLQDVQEEL